MLGGVGNEPVIRAQLRGWALRAKDEVRPWKPAPAATPLVGQLRSRKTRRAGTLVQSRVDTREGPGEGQGEPVDASQQCRDGEHPCCGDISWRLRQGPDELAREKTPAFPRSAARQPCVLCHEWELTLCPSGGCFVETPEFQKPQHGCLRTVRPVVGLLTAGI